MPYLPFTLRVWHLKPWAPLQPLTLGEKMVTRHRNIGILTLECEMQEAQVSCRSLAFQAFRDPQVLTMILTQHRFDSCTTSAVPSLKKTQGLAGSRSPMLTQTSLLCALRLAAGLASALGVSRNSQLSQLALRLSSTHPTGRKLMTH